MDDPTATTKIKHVTARLQPLLQDDGAVRWAWVVEKCPFCQETHVHRGGDLVENPFRALGQRESNCKDEVLRRHYELIYGGLLPYWDRKGSPPSSTAARYVSNPTKWLATMREMHGKANGK